MTNINTAVILAAGRGSRLGQITDNKPKGLTDLCGYSLLEWQHLILKSSGIKDIYVITGYLNKLIDAKGYKTIFNPDWNKGNMISSLMLALDSINTPFILSYSDIIYSKKIIIELLKSNSHLAVAYDKNWLKLWKQRFKDPLSDAESFILGSDSNIIEIGSKTDSIDKIEGQFMGLLKVDSFAKEEIIKIINTEVNIKFELDTTSLLNNLILNRFPVKAVKNCWGWCEIDSPSDLNVANSLIYNGIIKKPF